MYRDADRVHDSDHNYHGHKRHHHTDHGFGEHGHGQRESPEDQAKLSLAAQLELQQHARSWLHHQDGETADKGHLDMSPIQEVLDASKVRKADGWYQVAERLLDLDKQKHGAPEIEALVKILQEEVADEGRTIKRGDIIITANNFESIMELINGERFPGQGVKGAQR